MSETNEGWKLPSQSNRWHFFRESRSLCGKWGLTYRVELEGDRKGATVRTEECAACWKKRQKANDQAQEMLFREHGINWSDRPNGDKRGRCVIRHELGWKVDDNIPVFTTDRDYVRNQLPRRED